MLARQALDSLSYLPSPALEFSVSPGYPQTRCVPLNIGPSSADSDVLELKVCVPPHTAVFMLFFSVQKIKKKKTTKKTVLQGAGSCVQGLAFCLSTPALRSVLNPASPKAILKDGCPGTELVTYESSTCLQLPGTAVAGSQEAEPLINPHLHVVLGFCSFASSVCLLSTSRRWMFLLYLFSVVALSS